MKSKNIKIVKESDFIENLIESELHNFTDYSQIKEGLLDNFSIKNGFELILDEWTKLQKLKN